MSALSCEKFIDDIEYLSLMTKEEILEEYCLAIRMVELMDNAAQIEKNHSKKMDRLRTKSACEKKAKKQFLVLRNQHSVEDRGGLCRSN